MLIEQLLRALLAGFLELAFRPGAAELRAIGGGFLFRLLALGPLPELFQIDQISHASLRHADSVAARAMQSIDKCVRVPVASNVDGSALIGSILIYQIPH
jgi:hypothetical protein